MNGELQAVSIIKSRRCVRSFLPKPVPKEIVEDIIDCARFAPTANNEQPWEFIVVTKAETRKKIADATGNNGRFITEVPVCVVTFCKETKYFLEDGAAASQNILLAAWAHGIRSCWVAGDKKPYADTVRQILGLPIGYKLVSLIPLGYSSEIPHIKKRNLKDLLHWEQYHL
ncbi:MAG: nitroreductase family protein [Elusimicrobia bacterium]|nr:nitroreductase family protein [Candidatus Obscuribacterium magneticum]